MSWQPGDIMTRREMAEWGGWREEQLASCYALEPELDDTGCQVCPMGKSCLATFKEVVGFDDIVQFQRCRNLAWKSMDEKEQVAVSWDLYIEMLMRGHFLNQGKVFGLYTPGGNCGVSRVDPVPNSMLLARNDLLAEKAAETEPMLHQLPSTELKKRLAENQLKRSSEAKLAKSKEDNRKQKLRELQKKRQEESEW